VRGRKLLGNSTNECLQKSPRKWGFLFLFGAYGAVDFFVISLYTIEVLVPVFLWLAVALTY
jgi:hypothetical protein